MFAPLLTQGMLLEELADGPLSRHEELLGLIMQTGPLTVEIFEKEGREATLGTIRPRYKIDFFWNRKKMRLWRLEALWHPLWLGEDGDIYRAYDEFGGSDPVDFQEDYATPHYWMRAEIDLRGQRGLERILYALENPTTPQVRPATSEIRLHNGAEM